MNKWIKKSTVIWFVVWFLLIYINGLDEFFLSEDPLWQRILLPLLCGTFMFLVAFFSWKFSYRPAKHDVTLSKGEALFLLAVGGILLALYASRVINFAIFLLLVVAWATMMQIFLKEKGTGTKKGQVGS